MNTTPKRFADALAIQCGAVNIAAMARTLVNACDEVQAEHGTLADDCAIKLIVHQIAFISGIINGAEEFHNGTYSDCDKGCRKESVLQDVADEFEFGTHFKGWEKV